MKQLLYTIAAIPALALIGIVAALAMRDFIEWSHSHGELEDSLLALRSAESIWRALAAALISVIASIRKGVRSRTRERRKSRVGQLYRTFARILGRIP